MHPDEALDLLFAGNKRFVTDQSQSPRQCSGYCKQLVKDQTPFCAVLTCSDSRVPVEILFDQGIGDIFVVRLAGNVASQTAVESLDFAVHMLKVSLIVVMGHQNCGAVSAAFNHLAKDDLGAIGTSIHSAIQEAPSLREAVIANVNAQVSTLQQHLPLQPELNSDTLKICGTYYDFETGLVSLLEAGV